MRAATVNVETERANLRVLENPRYRKDKKFLVSERRFKKTCKTMLTLWIMSLVLIATIVGTSVYFITAQRSAMVYYTTTTVVVEDHDTLWGIADDLDAPYDIRKVVKEIRDMNNLESATIYPGEVLRVPVFN